jgi:signal transduction histidine kinase
VTNARQHGQPPITVAWGHRDRFLWVSVQDLGSYPAPSHTKGLGFGLDLVRRIAKEMGGRLEFSHAPTTFTLWLRGVS